MIDHDSPRENDHLVEPMYAGLEVEASTGRGASRKRWLVWGALLLAAAALIALLR